MNYLEKRKSKYENQIEVKKSKLKHQKHEYMELKKEYEYYEFQTYEDIMEEIQNLMQSNDYQTSQYMKDQVAQLKKKAPDLERYGRAKEFMKDLQYDIKELEHFLNDTREDLKRLKIRQKYLIRKIKSPEYRGDRSSYTNISHLSNNSMFLSANLNYPPYWYNKPSQKDNSESAFYDDDDSSRSLRSMIKAENFFQMKTNSFINLM